MFIEDRFRKPALEGFDPGLVNSEWEWFWSHASIALSLSDGQTDNVRNWAYPPQRWEFNAVGPGVGLGVGLRGRFMRGANTSFDISMLVPTAGDPLPPNSASDDISIFIAAANLGTREGTQGAILTGDVGSDRITIPSDDTVDIILAGETLHSSIGTVPATGPFTLGVFVSRSGPYRVYIDGIFDSETLSSGNFGTFTPLSEIFGSAGSSNRDIELYCCYAFNNYEVPAQQFKQLHDDPFGMFHVDDEVLAFVAAAVSGLSIPVAMHEYRQRHQSVV